MTETRVRSMVSADLGQVLAWRNHPDVQRYMFSRHEITPQEHRQWFERIASDPLRHPLIFEVGGIATGFVAFNQLVQPDIADWGFYLAPGAPSGTGSGLGHAALKYAFGQLQLHKVCGQALATNERSVRFHERLGFQTEGILRDQYFDDGHYQNVICFGLLRREWQAREGES